MKPEDRTQNMRDSVHKFGEATSFQIQTLWNQPRSAGQHIVLGWQEEDAPDPDPPVIVPVYLTEEEFNSSVQRLEALLELHILVRSNRFLHRFIRSRLFSILGFLRDSDDIRGFIPLKNYAANDVSPLTEDQIIVLPFGEAGWREIKPGEDSRILDDASVLHYVATLILQY